MSMPKFPFKTALAAAAMAVFSLVAASRAAAQEISSKTVSGVSAPPAGVAAKDANGISLAGQSLDRVAGSGLPQSPGSFNPDGSASKPEMGVAVPTGASGISAASRLAPSKPLAAASAPAVPAPPAPQPPARKTFEDRAYKISTLAFTTAGLFDLASTVYGISHLPRMHEANSVFLALFGKKNARNIPLIAAGWVATHLSVQFVAKFLFRHAKKEAALHHKYKRFFLDAAALGLMGFGTVWHIQAASTWYGAGKL